MTRELRYYEAFGARLETRVEFPELTPTTPGPARWHFRTVPALAEMRDPVALGADRLYDEIDARMFAHADGHRIIVDDTGAFELSRDRRDVSCLTRPGAWPDFVRAHLLGRVLSTALWLDGLLPLHCSGVATVDGIVAFLAPKGFGKSTLALALSDAGALLVSDDTLPVDPSHPPTGWPGIQSLRVHADALDAVGVGRPALATREGKHVLRALPHHRLLHAAAPIAAIYLIDPVPPTAAAVTRTPLPPMLASIGLVAHVKIGRMLGGSAAALMLERAAAVARMVPVHRLHLPRDLTRIDEAVRAILQWHGPVA